MNKLKYFVLLSRLVAVDLSNMLVVAQACWYVRLLCDVQVLHQRWVVRISWLECRLIITNELFPRIPSASCICVQSGAE